MFERVWRAWRGVDGAAREHDLVQAEVPACPA